jgi:hypothetical protein
MSWCKAETDTGRRIHKRDRSTNVCTVKSESKRVGIKTDVRKNEQDRRCTYNVTMRCARAAIVAVEKQLVLHSPSAYL